MHQQDGFWEERLAVGHEEMQPVKRRVSAAFFRPRMFYPGREQYKFSRTKIIVFFAFADMNYARRNEYNLISFQRNRTVNPWLIGIEQARIIVLYRFVVKRNQVGFSHLTKDFFIDNSPALYYNLSVKSTEKE